MVKASGTLSEYKVLLINVSINVPSVSDMSRIIWRLWAVIALHLHTLMFHEIQYSHSHPLKYLLWAFRLVFEWTVLDRLSLHIIITMSLHDSSYFAYQVLVKIWKHSIETTLRCHRMMVHNVVVIATSSVVDWLYFSSHFPVYAGHWNYTNSSGVTIIGAQNAVLYVALSNTAVIKVID